METLTFDTILAHADYIRLGLLSLLVLVARGRLVRLMVALLAGFELTLAITGRADQTTLIWAAVVLGAALLILLIGVIAGGMARLTPEEQAMSGRLLKGVSRSRVRHFLDQGYWLNGTPGEVLLRENEPVKQFCYLASGEARVSMGGRAIGFCRDGDVIGGLGFFSGEMSAATVALASPARFWVAPQERIKPYFDAHPELRARIQRMLAGPPDDPVHRGESSANADLRPPQFAEPGPVQP